MLLKLHHTVNTWLYFGAYSSEQSHLTVEEGANGLLGVNH